MKDSINVPVVSIVGLVATVLGVLLGNSTVNAINPDFYRGPAVHPRDRGAAVEPSVIETSPLPAYAVRDWPEGGAAMRIACLGCGGRPAGVRGYAGAVPYFGSVEERRAREARERAEIDARYEAQMDARTVRDMRDEDVRRFTDEPEIKEPSIDSPALEDAELGISPAS